MAGDTSYCSLVLTPWSVGVGVVVEPRFEHNAEGCDTWKDHRSSNSRITVAGGGLCLLCCFYDSVSRAAAVDSIGIVALYHTRTPPPPERRIP